MPTFLDRCGSLIAAFTLLAVGAAASARSGDAPPSTPEGLTAVVYSPTAGAVRWQRSTDDAGFVPGYEIARDGTVLGTFDALSFVDRGLSPGTAYRYTVTAVDTAGQRSGTVAVTLLTEGDGPDSAGAAGPTAPAGLRAEVYSARNAELFWGRSATVGLVYEIRRDGAVVATTDGVSYYDDTLAAGPTYTYEIIAIDRQGRRSAPSRIDVRTDGDDPSTPPVSGGPDAPDELRAEVYSRTAAELFWQREPTALALRYEIRRDGEAVATTDGVSYFTDALVGGRDYRFAVVAIGRDGGRSAPAEVTVRTDGAGGGSGSGGMPPPVSPPPASDLASPANLRSAVYSELAAELFWDRTGTPGLRYEVSRDGEVVGTTNGTSFFDDGLAGGRTYGYEVVAFDDSRRSAPSTLTLATVLGSAIGVANRETVLREVIRVIDGTLFAEIHLAADILSENRIGQTLVESRRQEDNDRVLFETYACEQGGSVSRDEIVDIDDPSVTRVFQVVEDCRIAGVTYDGLITRVFEEGSIDVSLDDFSVTRSADDTAVISSERQIDSFFFFPDGESLVVRSYDARRNGERILVSGAATSAFVDSEPPAGTGSNRQIGRFDVATISAPWTGGVEIAISTPEDFAKRREEAFYPSGTLLVSADDGSELRVDAANGDPSSFTLSVFADGGVSAVELPWTEETLVPCESIDPGSLDAERPACAIEFGGL